ncbi:T-cell surface glycoprotein CD3 epsilon chain-like [Neoarius graeffei]|uniref:T-cell surface glycoprotein CD3 epsilon chain-like n=1 Tax=Neoarius graeffei TaxID=443677 RepID=UPI00298C5D35|nr:T-cell surface glycoprotein CD3 epsilon chain-like [Neoarius graeffei]
MNGSQVIYVFFFFAVAITVVAGESGSVDIKDLTVTLDCKLNEKNEVTWSKNDNEITKEPAGILTLRNYDDKMNGFYKCKTTEKTHYFYIKAKVCQSCVDLDMTTASLLVIGDVLFTFGIVVLVYFCTRKKSGTAAPQRAIPGRQPRGPARGPPPPDPDYQTLIQATRSNDVYAQAQPHRR